MASVRKFKERNPKDSNARDWQNLYIRELQEKHKKAKIGEIVCVNALSI